MLVWCQFTQNIFWECFPWSPVDLLEQLRDLDLISQKSVKALLKIAFWKPALKENVYIEYLGMHLSSFKIFLYNTLYIFNTASEKKQLECRSVLLAVNRSPCKEWWERNQLLKSLIKAKCFMFSQESLEMLEK